MADFVIPNSSAGTNFNTSTGEFAGSGSAPTGSISDNDASHDKLSTNDNLVGIFLGQTIDNTPIKYLGKITIEGTAYPACDFTDLSFIAIFGIELDRSVYPNLSSLPTLDTSDFDVDAATLEADANFLFT